MQWDRGLLPTDTETDSSIPWLVCMQLHTVLVGTSSHARLRALCFVQHALFESFCIGPDRDMMFAL